jgi:hypothetical protein
MRNVKELKCAKGFVGGTEGKTQIGRPMLAWRYGTVVV